MYTTTLNSQIWKDGDFLFEFNRSDKIEREIQNKILEKERCRRYPLKFGELIRMKNRKELKLVFTFAFKI